MISQVFSPCLGLRHLSLSAEHVSQLSLNLCVHVCWLFSFRIHLGLDTGVTWDSGQNPYVLISESTLAQSAVAGQSMEKGGHMVQVSRSSSKTGHLVTEKDLNRYRACIPAHRTCTDEHVYHPPRTSTSPVCATDHAVATKIKVPG